MQKSTNQRSCATLATRSAETPAWPPSATTRDVRTTQTDSAASATIRWSTERPQRQMSILPSMSTLRSSKLQIASRCPRSKHRQRILISCHNKVALLVNRVMGRHAWISKLHQRRSRKTEEMACLHILKKIILIINYFCCVFNDYWTTLFN